MPKRSFEPDTLKPIQTYGSMIAVPRLIVPDLGDGNSHTLTKISDATCIDGKQVPTYTQLFEAN